MRGLEFGRDCHWWTNEIVAMVCGMAMEMVLGLLRGCWALTGGVDWRRRTDWEI